MLKQGDIITYQAQGYTNAETVGQAQGYTVFVPQAIAGEKCEVKVKYVKRSVAYADVVKVLTPSPQRVNPLCKRFGKCGGCSLMHMSYAEQLVFKRCKVENNLRKIGKLNCDVLPCVPSPKQFEYRNKLSLPVRGVCGNVLIGMYKRNSHDVVAAAECCLADVWAKTLVKEFAEYLNAVGAIPYNENDFSGEVRHLVARYIDGQLLVVIVSNGVFKRDLQPLILRLSSKFKKFGLFVNENTFKNNVILGKTTKHIYGIKNIKSKHLGVDFILQPNSFFQVNDGVKNAIYAKVKELLDLSRTEALIDCFSGVGVLTNALADDKFLTYAIEIEPSAVEDAKELAELNGKHIVNICGDVREELPKLTGKLRGKRITMVVDPPRKGLGEEVCNAVIRAEVDNVVYISCDSATLARDLAQLSSIYDVTYVEPYDMFPQTDNVETVVRLARKTD